MATWDVFHADRLELERSLDAQTIRQRLTNGELRDDDLVRPSGTAVSWRRASEVPELIAPAAEEGFAQQTQEPGAISTPLLPEPGQPAGPPPSDFEEVLPRLDEIAQPPKAHQPTELPGPSTSSDVAFPVLDEPIRAPGRTDRPVPPSAPIPGSVGWIWDENDDEDEDDEEDDDEPPREDLEDIEILADEPLASASKAPATSSSQQPWEPSENDLSLNDRPDSRISHVALPVVRSRESAPADEMDEDIDPDTSFSLSRSATTKVEELDLAPMVDVAFNLVLFFMVTATTILYKTLEIPKPSSDAPAGAVAQGRSRTMDDLKDDYILVEIDESGATKLDREPIEPTMTNLVELLRTAREKTGRKSMLLSADFATPHRNAVLAYDAANEIGLGIAIAKPQPPMGPAPTLRPGAPAQPKPQQAPEPTR